ncbi:3-isopropylmalate dehydratase small subunit [Marinicella sp. W31]|uniref:3-isopropylmalate dehydratase small subunit n=1 Tax=Marinicella sp. W31 TaxID=3023713 RepID=UPI003757C54D
MKKKTHVEGLCIPLAMDDIDTDMIIPAQHLTQTTQAGYGEYAFQRLKQSDPDCVLNKTAFDGAKIMISGANFGCGSSREHAVWAILEMGIQAIIAESFADIFRNNAQKNKLILIEQPASVCQRLITIAQSEPLSIRIDIRDTTLHVMDRFIHFTMQPFFQHCLLNGIDELDYLSQQLTNIRRFKQQQSNTTLFMQTS